ncbi:hypothetical protein [Legionella waltersii]|uniref:Uncharacterized protein n=1 Tax=Legionella waltersii TaxID=66969 RepID=A0A0W1AAT3_9GAMM|nr:hypothetical protein [Legionella waltersii]KTD78476.1 hypothetical protein Lwal_1911 [Legionella waltersii]SNV05856.1 Uncharacterised protein [Legionella waltersii]
MDFDQEIDAEMLKKVIPGIQKLDEMLKGGGVPEDVLKPFSEFAEVMQKKHNSTMSTMILM